jgi:DNA polymerase type B, organellar and viral
MSNQFKQYRSRRGLQNILGRGPMPLKKPKIKNKPDVKFRVWDGEGKNFPDGTHRMVLLSNSDEEYVYNPEGLSTIECIQFLLQKREKKKDVWFSFGYDVTKILTDVPLLAQHEHDFFNLEHLWKRTETYYKGFHIKYIPRKIFSITRDSTERFHSTDIFSFFQVSFLKACDKWGIDASAIEQGKADRNIFDTYTFEDILTYNFLELRYAKELVTRLYFAFKDCNLVPSSWHGPGALAQTFFRKNNMLDHFRTKENTLVEMDIPIRQAYFGGRIDIAKIGEIDCYNYDIISAYPHGLTDCISLGNVYWHHQPFPFVDDRHALYHVVWDIKQDVQWGPFPWRRENGCVLFPSSGEGWYWGVEVLAAERLFGNQIQRKEAYYPMVIKTFPLKHLIEEAYEKRNKIGRHTGAGIAIKILLNSLYGKLAQSIGSKKWQNYIWAGYITAFTRAKILDAIKLLGDSNVVAIATDGIFTYKQMETGEERLGTWENGGHMRVLIVGAGLYTIIKDDGTIQSVKQRGLPENINHAWVLKQWGCNTKLDGIGEDSFTSHFTTFIGMGKAIHQNKPLGLFVTEERTLEDVSMGGTSKRVPDVSSLFTTGWKELQLYIRERPLGSPMLSFPYVKNLRVDEIKALRKVEDETAEG